MRQKQFVEKPTILDKDTLMCDGDFMSKERIKEQCTQCLYKSLCLDVANLLENKKNCEALRTLILSDMTGCLIKENE